MDQQWGANTIGLKFFFGWNIQRLSS